MFVRRSHALNRRFEFDFEGRVDAVRTKRDDFVAEAVVYVTGPRIRQHPQRGREPALIAVNRSRKRNDPMREIEDRPGVFVAEALLKAVGRDRDILPIERVMIEQIILAVPRER
jgi:hypothetical protein